MRGAIPGFTYDSKTRTAHIEVVLPGTGSRKRIRKTLSAVSREDALAEWKRFRESALAGVRHTPLTLQGFVDLYWTKISAGKGLPTVRAQRSVVKNHLLPAFGSTRLEKINTAAVRDFTAERKGRYSSATIANFLRVLSLLLHQAVERNEIHSYPIRGRRILPPATPPKLEMNPDEKACFLAAFEDEAGFRALLPCQDSRAAGFYFQRFRAMKPIFTVALETGLRKGDLLRLKWSSINLAEGLVSVRTGKTGQDVVIPMSRACREALEECKARPIVGRQVFVTEDGKPVSLGTVKRHFALAKRLAGITRRLRFHDLRHTFGSQLASAGVPLQVIAKVLGHSSIQMSERYARPSLESLKSVANALDQGETNSFANSKRRAGKP